MIDSRARLEELISKLRARGHRITPQRLAILKILAKSDGHPSAERIFEQIRADFPTTSLATVYKMIATLKGMNEVLELEFGDHSNRYDGTRPYPHVHVVCVNCRAIMDGEIDRQDVDPQQVAARAGYRLIGHRFDVYGVCPDCQAGSPG
jgi:Fur family peroxide stress response transcriptional regulator